jgi:hypothetical protein
MCVKQGGCSRWLEEAGKRQASWQLVFVLATTVAMIPFLIGCASSPMVGSSPSLVDQPRLEVTPSSVNFSSAIVGVQTSQTLKLSNTGEAALTVTGVIASGAGLSINGFSGSTLLSPGTSSTLTVNFTPKATGTFTGSVSVLTNTPSVTAALPVSGDVANANLAISVGPSSLSFGTVTAGKTASQNVKLTNTGNTDVTVSSIKVSGTGFSVTGWSSAVQLEPSQSTTVDVQFDPKNSGNYTGSLIVVSDASDSSVAVPLSGVVASASQVISVGPSSLSFGTVTAGKTISQNVTLTNTGNTDVTVSSVKVSGTGFSLSGWSSPVQLAASQSIAVNVQFDPKASGSYSGSLMVASDASDSSVAVPLSGAVAPAAAAPSAAHSVALAWDASSSAVSGYNVYRGGASNGPFTKLNGALVADLKFTDTSVTAGTTYYYVTTAVDSSGVESVYSNTAPAVVP